MLAMVSVLYVPIPCQQWFQYCMSLFHVSYGFSTVCPYSMLEMVSVLYVSIPCQVAVKVPSGLTLSSANVVMKDLTREIEVMASLDHPHIVKLFGITHSKKEGEREGERD